MRKDVFAEWKKNRENQLHHGGPVPMKAGLNFRWSTDGGTIEDADSRFADVGAVRLWRRMRPYFNGA